MFTQAYLDGRARKPHSHSRSIQISLEEQGSSTSGVCTLCDPVLSWHVSEFKSMVHTGSKYNRRKRIHPYPKKTNVPHYQDIVGQNNWLKSNVFDSLGNLIVSELPSVFLLLDSPAYEMSSAKCSSPTTNMTKLEVEEKRLL